MESDFRLHYEPRGRALTVWGVPVSDMSREELIALVGFLFENMPQQDDQHSDVRIFAEQQELEWTYPPSNDGLFEG